MKEERDLVLIARRLMTGVSPQAAPAATAPAASQPPAAQSLPTASPKATQPVATPSPALQLFPTPPPSSFSVAPTGWSSRPSVYFFHCLLRSLAFLFSFVSYICLAAPSDVQPSLFPELKYCSVVNSLALQYSTSQLVRSFCDITHKRHPNSEKVPDYGGFVLDQVMGYLLASSSSVMIPAIRRGRHSHSQNAFWKAGVLCVSMSFAAFLVTAICALFSVYKLCKRVMLPVGNMP